ncbi:MAG: V-type ATP synthase subunit E family protein, partial [Anaerolineaceae bacterium]|nr:V-type ATP synthase subunit E family protein [Anaerolineaceae bacterium]
TDTAYPTILRRLTKQALIELAGSLEQIGRAKLEADERDKSLLEEILQDLDLEIAVSYDLHCMGGVIAKSEDGRLVVINTMEARLERSIPFLRRYLAESFEGELDENVSSPVFRTSRD